MIADQFQVEIESNGDTTTAQNSTISTPPIHVTDTNQVGSDGFLADVTIQDIEDPTARREDRSRDINQFFQRVIKIDKKGYRRCTLCKLYVYDDSYSLALTTAGYHRNISAHNSTLRRHLEAHHKVRCILFGLSWYAHRTFKQAKYRAWCADNEYASKLPKDRQEAKAAQNNSLTQQSLSGYLTDPPIVYSDEAFRAAAIQWLAQADLVSNHSSLASFIDSICVLTVILANTGPRTSGLQEYDGRCCTGNEGGSSPHSQAYTTRNY